MTGQPRAQPIGALKRAHCRPVVLNLKVRALTLSNPSAAENRGGLRP